MVIVFALLFWISLAGLIWTYFGYPLFMFLWSKLRRIPVQKSPLEPNITLLIPAYNEADVISRKLDNALTLDYPADKLEVLVVDDGSTDGTTGILQDYQSKGIKVLTQTQRGGKMGAVNIGFANAKGEIVVLSDASPSYETEALRKLVMPFADPKVGVVVGELAIWDNEVGVAKQAGMYWKYEAALRRWETATGSTVAVHGNMFAIRKSLYRPLSAGTVNDEFSLAMEVMRQGYRVVYEPAAISYDDASQSMGDEFKRRVRINAGRYQALFSAGYLNTPNLNIAFRLFSHKLLRPLAPVLMLLVLIVNIVLVILSGMDGASLVYLEGVWGLLALLGQVGFYGLAWLGSLIEKRGGRKPIFISIPYFFVSTNIAALFGLWRWITRRQKVTWQKRSVE